MTNQENEERDAKREAAIIKLQQNEELDQANREYEQRLPAKVIVFVQKKKEDEVQDNTLPF